MLWVWAREEAHALEIPHLLLPEMWSGEDRDVNAALNLEREARRILQEELLVPVVDSGSGPTEKRLWRPCETEAGS
ncbi:hypothetical protein KDH_09400 [Dictyobacter sp. S3.2.2.5]|uniref:Uncharacterized protein n=1 Tax=Dictyobacter halimunensis TaxID=3026934 RepID=A0ABQ6FMQ1_9CHLR|nr:hypothetical protein KDH_09400 [Dictyobacter sp. S3.2.2.5]